MDRKIKETLDSKPNEHFLKVRDKTSFIRTEDRKERSLVKPVLPKKPVFKGAQFPITTTDDRNRKDTDHQDSEPDNPMSMSVLQMAKLFENTNAQEASKSERVLRPVSIVMKKLPESESAERLVVMERKTLSVDTTIYPDPDRHMQMEKTKSCDADEPLSMAGKSHKSKIPSVCNFYNQNRCNKSSCTFLHICKSFIEDTCDGCALSHDIKSDQINLLLAPCGFDVSSDGDFLVEQYRDRVRNLQGAAKTRRLNPPYVCSYYNETECTRENCTFVHICEKYIYGNCHGDCHLSHAIKEGQAWEKLSIYGYWANKSPEDIRNEYKADLARAQKKKKMTSESRSEAGVHETSEKVREKLRKLRDLAEGNGDSSESDNQLPYLVCRNYNKKLCTNSRCKYLHICGKFILDLCDKDSCDLNHRLFSLNNKRVLNGAGYDTEKNEKDLLKEYKRKSIQKSNRNQRGSEERKQTEEDKQHNKKGGNGKEYLIRDYRMRWKQDTERDAERKDRRQFETKGTQRNNDKKVLSETTKKLMIQDEDTDICRANIRQRCKYGDKCNRHHCDLPYHWQYKVPTIPWMSFPHIVNETLEMNYCNKDIDTTIVAVVSDQCQADFNQMKGKMKDGDILLRRLSTCSSCEAPPGETLVTQWRWFWKHDNGWMQYGDETKEIEEKYIENPDTTISMQIGQYQYQLDFKSMKQTNKESGKQRDLRRRPILKSKAEVEKEAKEKRKFTKIVDKKQQSAQQTSASGLPSDWTPMTDDEEEVMRVSLAATDEEFKNILSIFMNSIGRSDIQVCAIERIQNPFLWQNYAWKRQTMEKQTKDKGGANEMLLYHGTAEENINPICKTNFDWRLYGTTVGNIYGQGSYFANVAKYSDSGYAKHDKDGTKSMFIVKVLVGRYTMGSSNLRRPPPLDQGAPKGKLFDSTVDDIVNPKIYCVFHDSQYYPAYLIKYK